MSQDPVEGAKVMHSMLEGDNGIVLMAGDAPQGVERGSSSNVSISLSGDDETILHGNWDKLVEGGMIHEPLVTAPWGDTFGMLTDKFGTEWMVNIAAKKV